ncbi:LysR family transcriptional regulator [Desulfuromusa kysingii]|nr:LysR family transcriptional regulator [Desulfuromusa kysingii]
MESNYLKTLIVVGKYGNITRASEILHVSQPAISRRIKLLEDQFGQVLLDRSGTGVELTAAGKIVADKAVQMLELEKELISGLTTVETNEKLTFACTPSFGIAHLPQIMRDFMLKSSASPDLLFHFDVPRKIIAGLNSEIYCFSVFEHTEGLNLTGLQTISLPGDEMVFVASPKLEISEEEIEIDDVLHHTLYGRHEGCCSRSLLEINLQNNGLSISSFERLIIYDDLHLLIDAISNGDGIAFLSKDVVAKELATGNLKEFKVAGFSLARNRSLVTPSNFVHSNITKQLTESIFDYFKAQPFCGK